METRQNERVYKESITGHESFDEEDRLARELLKNLATAGLGERIPLMDRIIEELSPRAIANVAVHLYQETGVAEYPQYAASLLHKLGSGAWDTLCDLSHSEGDEIEYFTSSIALCPDIPEGDRAAALTRLARHPEFGVKSIVLHRLATFSPENAKPALEILAHDPDTEISEEARDLLSER